MPEDMVTLASGAMARQSRASTAMRTRSTASSAVAGGVPTRISRNSSPP
jgi:hypothetical protein